MKKLPKILLLPLILALSSCGYRTDGAYDAGQFLSGNFANNFYTGRNDFKDSVSKQSLSFTNADSLGSGSKFQNGYSSDGGAIIAFEDESGNAINDTVLQHHAEIFNDANGNALPYDMNTSYVQTLKENNDAAYVGKVFGRTKCLGTVEPSFKDTGVLSKLYNGQLHCLGQNNYSLVQFNEEGMNAAFPKTMVSADYFLASLRGGSTIGAKDNSNVNRLTRIDLSIRFFYADGYISLKFSELPLRTDGGAESVNFFGFSFADVGIDSAGMLGYGISYENLVDPNRAEYEKTYSDYCWGLLVYEVMLINSSWR